MASKNALPPGPFRAEPIDIAGIDQVDILCGPRQIHRITVFGSRRYPAKRLAEFIVECLNNNIGRTP